MQELQYPIGKFNPPTEINKLDLGIAIREIEVLPNHLKDCTGNLEDYQLDTAYRPGGWTVRQVVHHIAESHMNSYIRFKWTLTEKSPTIKAYDEKLWGELEDNLKAPVDISLDLISALHKKWVFLLKSLSESEWKKAFIHPETGKVVKLSKNVLLYAWHGKHHLAHIENLKQYKGW